MNRKATELRREHEVVLHINLMQQKEIVNLELKLRDQEEERDKIWKEMELLQETVIEKELIVVEQYNTVEELRYNVAQVGWLLFYEIQNLDVNSFQGPHLVVCLRANF